LLAVLATLFVAPSASADYIANYVYLGRFDSGYGTVDVSYDLNQPHDAVEGAISAAIKANVPSPNFYEHFVSAADHWSHIPNGDPNPSYFSELIAIDCDRRLARGGHAVYYNSQDQMVADHDYGFVPHPIEPNSLASVVAKKLCGS
jgi:hypothetical protein